MMVPQRPANQRIGERSPEDRMSERNERRDRRQRGQQNRAGALHRRLHHRVERIEPRLLVMMDLANQDQRIAHQDPRQGDQAHRALMPNG